MFEDWPVDQPFSVLSLGAGTQSSALLVAMDRGEITPKPQVAIFADTGAEPQYVYDWLEHLKKQVSIPVVETQFGNILEEPFEPGRMSTVPFFIKKIDGNKAIAMRQCTNDYKIQQVKREMRRLLGYKPRQRMKHQIKMSLGISLDEMQRMKESRDKWQENLFPLIENGWDRHECISYIQQLGLGNPPKSACYICPYRTNESWKALKREEPQAFKKATEWERKLQKHMKDVGRFVGTPHLHSSLKNLDEIDFDKLAPDSPLFGFDNECDGLCGV